MSRRKKKFTCGHVGYGRECHSCAHKESIWEEKRTQKKAWRQSFNYDPIDLTSLPKNVVLKARDIIKKLQNQTSYTHFRGKRLRHNRFIISIPVTRHYRLICRDCGSFVAPEAVVSHEDYNVCKPGI